MNPAAASEEPPDPPAARPGDDEAYSAATVLETGWGLTREPPAAGRTDPGTTREFPVAGEATAAGEPTACGGPPAPGGDDTARTLPEPAAPGRPAPGEVLRFGPGVPARTAPTGSGPGPGPAPAPRRRGGGRWRYAPAVLVLLAVMAYLGWQRLGPGLAVERVTVRTAPGGPACGGTADVVAVIGTNGEPGTLRYRWRRSDGTVSAPLRERVAEGQREARLHLLWTFHGEGRYAARAELELTAPAARTAAVRFVYTCP